MLKPGNHRGHAADQGPDAISRVTRTRQQARQSYDRISRLYDLFTGPSEQKYRDLALQRLAVSPGEIVLELGCGTGTCLLPLARAVGSTGRVFGLDLSPRMLVLSQRHLEHSGLLEGVGLTCGDALSMPYPAATFDAVFGCFVLELFDNPEIPIVLEGVQRRLRPGGRLGILSMSKGAGRSLLLDLYEAFHRSFPRYVDCRPIYAEQAIAQAGFEIIHSEQVNILGLPGEIVIGIRA